MFIREKDKNQPLPQELINLLKFVWQNDYCAFYREKFSKLGINSSKKIKTADDFSKLPFLTKDELKNRSPFDFLFIKEEDIQRVALTSGTSGRPAMLFRGRNYPYITPTAFKEVGAVRPMILQSPFQLPSVFFRLNKIEFSIITGDIHNLALSSFMIEQLKIDSLWTTPTLAFFLLKHLNKLNPALPKNIKLLLIGGERIDFKKKKELKKAYPNAVISVSYGSSELAKVGLQCLNLARDYSDYYHLRDENYIEVINTVTGESAGLGEKGELVATTLKIFDTPLIRYRTGDLVSLEKNNCSCGIKGPLLKVWGRVNFDMARVAGFELTSWQVEKAFEKFKNYLKEDFEIHIFEEGTPENPKIRLNLKLVLKDGIKDEIWLKNFIKENFPKAWRISPRLTLKEVIRSGIFLEPEIDFVESFEFQGKKRAALILH